MDPNAQQTRGRGWKAVPTVLCALMLCVVFYLLTLWLTGRNTTDPVAAERVAKLAGLNAKDRQRLENYDWVDRDQGIVRIPIQRAMEIVIPQLNAVPPHIAPPVQ